jgi:hypothetical protein
VNHRQIIGSTILYMVNCNRLKHDSTSCTVVIDISLFSMWYKVVNKKQNNKMKNGTLALSSNLKEHVT